MVWKSAWDDRKWPWQLLTFFPMPRLNARFVVLIFSIRLPKSLANLSLAKFKTENKSLARLARLARPVFRYNNLSNPIATNWDKFGLTSYEAYFYESIQVLMIFFLQWFCEQPLIQHNFQFQLVKKYRELSVMCFIPQPGLQKCEGKSFVQQKWYIFIF